MLNLKTTLISAVAIALVSFTSGWVTQGWRLNARIDQMLARHSLDLSRATQAALNESIRLQKLKDDALNEANKISQANAKAAADARSELDRLRRQLTSTSSLSTATCPSARNYAATLATVFGECATRIGELAEKADGHALDSRTLNGAFPK